MGERENGSGIDAPDGSAAPSATDNPAAGFAAALEALEEHPARVATHDILVAGYQAPKRDTHSLHLLHIATLPEAGRFRRGSTGDPDDCRIPLSTSGRCYWQAPVAARTLVTLNSRTFRSSLTTSSFAVGPPVGPEGPISCAFNVPVTSTR